MVQVHYGPPPGMHMYPSLSAGCRSGTLSLAPAAKALAPGKSNNDLCLLDRPACSLPIGGRSLGCIGCVHECVKRGRQFCGDVHRSASAGESPTVDRAVLR